VAWPAWSPDFSPLGMSGWVCITLECATTSRNQLAASRMRNRSYRCWHEVTLTEPTLGSMYAFIVRSFGKFDLVVNVARCSSQCIIINL
jgi:hypothetical protein